MHSRIGHPGTSGDISPMLPMIGENSLKRCRRTFYASLVRPRMGRRHTRFAHVPTEKKRVSLVAAGLLRSVVRRAASQAAEGRAGRRLSVRSGRSHHLGAPLVLAHAIATGLLRSVTRRSGWTADKSENMWSGSDSLCCRSFPRSGRRMLCRPGEERLRIGPRAAYWPRSAVCRYDLSVACARMGGTFYLDTGRYPTVVAWGLVLHGFDLDEPE